MQRWEYCELGSGVLSKFTSAGDEPVSLKKSEYKNNSLAIYALGREGWEMYQIVDANRFWFKRPLPPDEETTDE